MIFRFLEYDYSNEKDMYQNARFIAGVSDIKDYDVFLNALLKLMDHKIIIQGKLYELCEIICEYDGFDYNVFCVNIYMCRAL